MKHISSYFLEQLLTDLKPLLTRRRKRSFEWQNIIRISEDRLCSAVLIFLIFWAVHVQLSFILSITFLSHWVLEFSWNSLAWATVFDWFASSLSCRLTRIYTKFHFVLSFIYTEDRKLLPEVVSRISYWLVGIDIAFAICFVGCRCCVVPAFISWQQTRLHKRSLKTMKTKVRVWKIS